MKTLITLLCCLAGASLTMGTQFAAPDLTEVHNSYELSAFKFQVIVSKNKYSSLGSVGIQNGDKKVFAPTAELENIDWPRLDQIEVTKELDSIYVKIPYGQDLPGIKGHFSKVCYEFKNDVYVGRERIVPTKQITTEDRIVTNFQRLRKLPGKKEQIAGTEGIEGPSK